ncbi:FMN-dependent NADH-azoreductase [Glacieibacterium megasporae]|uniref:FMN-dependent NADH-azoreductase n=1 Tax=Glacieibacterium megasporae TaxID=2835787 RepID=UPI001C1E763F|nr:NAD(P)H-dependent oxidoreductase [Polymorphobacter megasporae]UAJ10990.1 NAD(P)H-dependent oxidoreductase [Polymorphobacter megasporae]
MTVLLHIDSSVRGERSISRRLSKAFVDAWLTASPRTTVLRRDLSVCPPHFVDESWIAAAFTDPASRTTEMRDALADSDELIDELEAADVLLLGTPMFNYGMPARLKAWVDLVVRVGRTFSFDLERGDYPLEAMLFGKSLVLLTSTGEFGFASGGPRATMNHLDTHIATVRGYLGVQDMFHVGVEYQEFGDVRHAASVATALAAIPGLVASVAGHIEAA